MKKLIGIALAGSLFGAPAMAQDSTGTLDALGGAVDGLVTTLTTQDFQPLIDGLAGSNGLIRGDIAAPGTLNFTLTGLLVNQDPDQVATGLENTVGVTLEALQRGLGGGGLAASGSGDGAGLPGLDALPALPGL